MYAKIGYYLQMVAAYLLLALTHYFASGFLPIADCDETFNFIEPIHYLLYGSGKQTWENCPQYALRSWLFSWVYAWPSVFIKGAASLSSADVYYYLRIFNGRIAALAELYFVYSVWAAFSGKAAMVTLMLLLVNYPIPHAAVSVLPTSFVMICNFVVLGSWLRTRSWTAANAARAAPAPAAAAAVAGAGQQQRAKAISTAATPPRHLNWSVGFALLLSVFGGITGWPFAGLVSVPLGLDLLVRFPAQTVVFMAISLLVVVAGGAAMDTHYYGRLTLSGWNVVAYNVFGGADRGPELFDVEPWFFFWKNLTLNFHLLFLAVLVAPAVVLCAPRRGGKRLSGGSSTSVSRSSAPPLVDQGDARPPPILAEEVILHGNGSAAGAADASTRQRTHPTGSPERRSPLLSGRHPQQTTVLAAPSTASTLPRRPSVPEATVSCSRGRELLYMLPFFLWFAFWMCIAHKEERFMSPAYPFMVLAAARAICLTFFPDVNTAGAAAAAAATTSHAGSPTTALASGSAAAGATGSAEGSSAFIARRTRSPVPSQEAEHAVSFLSSPTVLAWRRAAGLAFFAAFFLLSYSRAMAVYTFYSGPERIFYDWYPVLRQEAQHTWQRKTQERRAAAAAAVAEEGERPARTTGATPQQTRELQSYFTLCLGREWYRFPSSFFVDQRYTRYQFVNTSFFHGMLPVSFITPPAGYERGFLWSPSDSSEALSTSSDTTVGGARVCGAPGMNDMNREIPEQYVPLPAEQCDAIFDSLSPPTHISAAAFEEERRQRLLDTVFTRSLLNASVLQAALSASGEPFRPVDDAYAVMDVDRTPLWCRVLYYPFGISKRCAAWRPLVLHART